MRSATFALTLLLAAAPLFGWGEKGHFIANEAATWNVPAEMPVFFHKAYPRLVWLGYDPDRWRGAGPSLDDFNAPNHFLDYEFTAGIELTPKRYEFIEAMKNSGALRRWGIEVQTAGFAPWHIAELCELLERQWRMWRETPEGIERRQIEETIIFTAGVLGHYVSDIANPHHTTIHYNGWASADNPYNYPTDCGAHGRFESQFVTTNVDLSEVIPRLQAPQLRNDYFAEAMALIRESNDLVDTLYSLDRDGAFAYREGTRFGEQFAADRLAKGASVLRDLWWSTWKASETRPSRR